MLARFLNATDGPDGEALLEELICVHAEPIVRRVVATRLRGDHTGDVCNDVLADLIFRLRGLKLKPSDGPIADFEAYCATAAYHGCNQFFRQRYPQRARLRNRLHYLFKSHPRLALWNRQGEVTCGRSEWCPVSADRHGERPAGRQDAVWASSRQSLLVVQEILSMEAGHMPFERLVDQVAARSGIIDQSTAYQPDIAQNRPSVETRLALRQQLNWLWSEVAQLPRAQRVALLLSLRDENGSPALPLLPVTGVASVRSIAALLEIEPEQLAEMWPHLPVDDLAIGERLGLRRQQVINLRKSARERLGRRLAAVAPEG